MTSSLPFAAKDAPVSFGAQKDRLMSLEEENCLKSALAFLVLRRRAAARDFQNNEIVDSKRGRDDFPGPSMPKRSSSSSHSATDSWFEEVRKRRRSSRNNNNSNNNDNKENNGLNPLIQSVLLIPFSSSSHKSRSEAPPRGIDSTTAAAELDREEKHVLSMFRVAVSMTLPVYDRVCAQHVVAAARTSSSGSTDDDADKKNNDDDEDDEPKESPARFFPPIFDHVTKSADERLSSSSVVDGLVVHIASRVTGVLDRRRRRRRPERAAATASSSDEDPTATAKEEEEEKDGSVHDGELGRAERLVYDGFFSLLWPPVVVSPRREDDDDDVDHDDHDNHGSSTNGAKTGTSSGRIVRVATDRASLVANVRTVLAVCYVLQRLVSVDARSSSWLGPLVMDAVCRTLNELYHDRCERAFVVSSSSCRRRRRRRSCEASEPPPPELADVVAVNMLHLLEEICATRLEARDAVADSDGGCSADEATDIIRQLQHGLGDLAVPVPPEQTANFYHIEHKRYSSLMRRRPASMKRILLRMMNNARRTENNSGPINKDSQQDPGDVEELTEIACLCPGGKMMLRSFLFGIIEKLSCHAT